MIFMFIFLVIIFFIVISILRSDKSLKHMCNEMKYELIYNILGAKALFEDVLKKNRNKTDLPNKSDQIAVVTGGARGIGTEVVKMLMQCDMHIIIGCRNVAAGEKLEESVRDQGIETGSIKCFQLDLCSFESIRAFGKVVAEKYPKIHLLINNAGIMFGPYVETKDGFESQFGINYLGHFLLTHLLLPQLKAGGADCDTKARIINVSSCAHLAGDINFEDINMKEEFITAAAYAQSKLAQVLFSNYLNLYFKAKNVPILVFSVHPGVVDTDLFNDTPLKTVFPWLPRLIFKTAAEGATSIVYTCVSSKLENKGGSYISNCTISPVNPLANSVELQEKLFKFSKNLLDIEEFGTN